MGSLYPEVKNFGLVCELFLESYFLRSRLLPESCRWLINQGRLEEAKKIVEMACRVNKKTVPQHLLCTSLDGTGALDYDAVDKVSSIAY